jgi:hypothetical protein
MKWVDIRRQYPNQFVLLGNLVEEKISETQYKIVEGTILKVSDDAKEIRRIYQQYKREGKEVIYALPSTPPNFIVENVPFMGILP